MRLTKPKTLTINRDTWSRGGHNGPPRLLNDEGHQCCLGFYAEACGVPREELLNVSSPHKLWVDGGVKLPSMNKTRTHHTKTADSMIRKNDDSWVNDTDREARLTLLFKRIGVEVEFV